MFNEESVFKSPAGSGFQGPVRPKLKPQPAAQSAVVKPPRVRHNSTRKSAPPRAKQPGGTNANDASLPELKKREWQILAHLVILGSSNKHLAHELRRGLSDAEAKDLSEGTVKVYFSKLLKKLGLKSRDQLAPWWETYGVHYYRCRDLKGESCKKP